MIGPLPDFTNTHQICLDVPNIIEITQILASVGIVTLPMRTPSKNRSGIRLGVQELCRLGLEDKDLETLAEIILFCVKRKNIEFQKSKVEKLAKKLNKIKYTLPYKQSF